MAAPRTPAVVAAAGLTLAALGLTSLTVPSAAGAARPSGVSAVVAVESPPPGDAVPVRRPSERLRLPGAPATRLAPRTSDRTAAWGSQASRRVAARYRYALSFVVIPIKGQRLGFSRSQVRAMTARVGARMAEQTGNRVTYEFASWTVARKVRSASLPCDVYPIHRRYRSLARYLRRTPAGYRDTIAVYLTPPRAGCAFAGIAVLRGEATYLNGLDLRDPQRLQDWITAHELGHNLGLDHSASFWPATGAWNATHRVPLNQRSQEVADYGDYLDVMGQPPRGGASLPGAMFGRWVLNSLSLNALGVLRDANVTYVRRSGDYVLNQLLPARAGGIMDLAIPVTADGLPTYWVLEFRPAAQNALSVRYPEPFASRGYGVRLLQVAHGGGLFLNKVFHVSEHPAAPGALPVGVPVRLGGGATVTVLGYDASRAVVRVSVAG